MDDLASGKIKKEAKTKREKSVRKQKHETNNYDLPRKHQYQETKVKPCPSNQNCTTAKGPKTG